MPWSCFLWKTNCSSEKSSRSFNFAKRNLSLRTQLCFSAFSPLDFVLHDFSPSSILGESGDLVFPGLLQLIYTFGSQPFLCKWFNANVFKCAVTTSNGPNIGQCWIFTGLIRLLSTQAKVYCVLFGVKSLGISVIFLKSPVTYIAKTIRGRTSNI